MVDLVNAERKAAGLSALTVRYEPGENSQNEEPGYD
jgi:hypothetical protein